MLSSFHHVYSQNMRPLEMVAKEYQKAIQSWLCPACKSPRPGTGSVDVIVESRGSRDATLNFVMGAGLAVAKYEALLCLGHDRVHRDLCLGRVLSRNGSIVHDLVTFRGRESLIVRGRRNVSHRYCPECGRLHYFSTIGKRYLAEIPRVDVELFESQLYGLVFSEELSRTSDISHWKRVTHETLPILNPPPDGLGELSIRP